MSPKFLTRFFILLLAAVSPASAEEDRLLEYNRDVRPILSENCFACHGSDAKARKSGLRLDVREGAHGKAKSGALAIVPGDPEASELWKRVSSADPDEMMPPPESHKELTVGEREVLKQWIRQGAKYEAHWAFLPPKRFSLPADAPNAIDFLVRRKLAEAGLSPSPEANRETLLRRLSFDLTGLPPSLEELDAFISDESPRAYEKQVDRLLASPKFGEHMAAAWLDLARYSDSNGYLHDSLRTPWPWRDWVIAAFNKDMPFDQFVVEQLAGDLLPEAAQEQILATAFLRNHPITTEGGSLAPEYLNEYAADRVQTVGTVFLGLTFACCRCHDHKFDPLPQEDFYSLLSYFNSSTEGHMLNNRVTAFPPLIEIASPLASEGAKAKVMVMDEAPKPNPTFVLTRGSYDQPDKSRPVTRRPPSILGDSLEGQPDNRLGLARWLVSKENPLLARVTVNRFWQRIFGAGLVATVDDFGVQGGYPSHPELLDHLAVEFRDGPADDPAKAWSMKSFLRLIVTSSTYRQQSLIRVDLAPVDPDNRLLGRFPRIRLSSEQIRDAALFTSGLLSETMGGPPVRPYQPKGLWLETTNQPGSPTGRYVQGKGSDLYRRSLYTFHKRTLPPPTMTLFDAPDRTGCTAQRVPTNTPLQALATMNDVQHLECARLLATRTLQEPGSVREQLTRLFRRVTGRTPSLADLKILEDGLEELETRYRGAPGDAKALLKQGDAPPPEGIDQPALAAWMIIASTLLNLDETLVRD